MHRRMFLKTLAAGLNGLIGLAVVIPGMRFLLDPLRRAPHKRGFIRVAPVTSLTVGRPQRVTVPADRWDAYTHHPPGPIGNVWLLHNERDDRDPKIRCLHVICPHLGCAIDYAADRNAFNCPCHASEFDPTGRRRFGPATWTNWTAASATRMNRVYAGSRCSIRNSKPEFRKSAPRHECRGSGGAAWTRLQVKTGRKT